MIGAAAAKIVIIMTTSQHDTGIGSLMSRFLHAETVARMSGRRQAYYSTYSTEYLYPFYKALRKPQNDE